MTLKMLFTPSVSEGVRVRVSKGVRVRERVKVRERVRERVRVEGE